MSYNNVQNDSPPKEEQRLLDSSPADLNSANESNQNSSRDDPISIEMEERQSTLKEGNSSTPAHLSLANQLYWNDSTKEIYYENDKKIKVPISLEDLYKGVLYLPSADLEKRGNNGMCLLHNVLTIIEKFSSMDKDIKDKLLKIVKLLLIKSDTDYRDYTYADNGKIQKNCILTLLKQIDKSGKEDKKYDVTFFFRQILNGEEDKFIHDLRTVKSAPENYLTHYKNVKSLLEATFAVGSLKTLKELLNFGEPFNHFKDDKNNLLFVAINTRKYVKPRNIENYYECFDFILSTGLVDVNATEPEEKSTALHIAKDPILIKKLLSAGAKLNIKDKNEQLPIEKIDFTYEILESHLDSCIVKVPKEMVGLENFWNLITEKDEQFANVLFIDITSFNKSPDNTVDTLDFIKTVRDVEKLKKAITHPCLEIISEIYWKTFKYWILWKKLPMILLSILILGTFFSKSETNDIYCWVVSVFGCIVAIKGGFEIYRSCGTRTPYKKLLYLEFACSILPAIWLSLMIYQVSFIDSYMFLGLAYLCASLAITTYLAIWFEAVANTLLMFIEVICSTVLYSFHMILIFIGFSFCLQVMFSNYDKFNLTDDQLKNDSEVDQSENKSKLSSGYYSFYKSIFISIGEVGADELTFNSFWSFLLIFLFILFICISFMNLLNGLAFDDVTTVKKEAEYLYRRFQIRFLLVEKDQLQRKHPACSSCSSSLFSVNQKLFIKIRNFIRHCIRRCTNNEIKSVKEADLKTFDNYTILGIDKAKKIVKSFHISHGKQLQINKICKINEKLLNEILEIDMKNSSIDSSTITADKHTEPKIEWNILIKGHGENFKEKLNKQDIKKICGFIGKQQLTDDFDKTYSMNSFVIKNISIVEKTLLIECMDERTYKWIDLLNFESINYRIVRRGRAEYFMSMEVLATNDGYTEEEIKYRLEKANPGLFLECFKLYNGKHIVTVKSDENGKATVYFSVSKIGYDSIKAFNSDFIFVCMMTKLCDVTEEERKELSLRSVSRIDFELENLP